MNRGEVEIAADGEKSPAYAGMNRRGLLGIARALQKPRVCGDEPDAGRHGRCACGQKPRVCGDEPVLRKFKAGERTKAPRV